VPFCLHSEVTKISMSYRGDFTPPFLLLNRWFYSDPEDLPWLLAFHPRLETTIRH